jgi:hypothetical protein
MYVVAAAFLVGGTAAFAIVDGTAATARRR